MTGTGRRVIEIIETESDCIDRVLVLLKPNLSDVQLSKAPAEAGGYAKRLIVKRRRTGMWAAILLTFIIAAAAGFAACYLFF